MNVIADKYKTGMRNKLSMYSSLLDFRYKNLCVKTNQEALLPIEIKTKNRDLPLEEVAQIGIMDDEHFLVAPTTPNMLQPICQAFLTTHPQLKQEIILLDQQEDLDPETKAVIEMNKEIMKEQTGEELPPLQALLLTTPEVNDNLKDRLDDAVSVLKKQCEVKYQKELLDNKKRMAISMTGAAPKDLDNANKELDQMYDQCWQIVEELTAAELADIADANRLYHLREEERNRVEVNDPYGNMSEHDKKAAFTYNPNAEFEE